MDTIWWYCRAFALGSISKVILFLAKVSITLITVVISAQTIVEKSATGALYYYSLAVRTKAKYMGYTYAPHGAVNAMCTHRCTYSDTQVFAYTLHVSDMYTVCVCLCMGP